MPGFITHLFFGKQAIHSLENNKLNRILNNHSCAFSLGLQGPDFFFYYIPSYFLHSKNIGSVIHNKNVMLFFDNLLNARNDLDNVIEKRIADAYICGFIGHYTLDTTCHPYVYYRSNHFKALQQGKTYDFGNHVTLETDIDHVVLAHFAHVKPTEFDYAKAIGVTPQEQDVICFLLEEAINNTFLDANITYSEISKAISSFIALNRIMNDPTGNKKRIVRTLEECIMHHPFISSMVPSDKHIKFKDPCNIAHKTWCNPWAPEIKSSASVFDIMNDAIPVFIDRLSIYYNSVNENLDEDINDIVHYRNKLLENLSDISYTRGLPL